MFPLAPSLKAVRRDLISFWSPFDFLHLGIGTYIFGTADGVHGKSAGLTGFDLSVEANEEDKRELAKVREVKWQAEMIASLNCGDHLGTSMPLSYSAMFYPSCAPRLSSLLDSDMAGAESSAAGTSCSGTLCSLSKYPLVRQMARADIPALVPFLKYLPSRLD